MSNVIDINKKLMKPATDVMVFACDCKFLTQSGYHSVFHIHQSGYECANCGKWWNFDQVHGKH